MFPKLHHQSVIGFGCFLFLRQKALHQHCRGVCTSLFPVGCLGRTHVKEVGAGVGGTVGTSFTFASSAKDQLIAEAARGVMQGASQLLQKKLRTVKVTVKSGHRLFLVQAK